MEGKPNQLYAQGMRSFEQYDEIHKYFAERRLANEVQAQLQLYDVSLGEYLVNKYAQALHGLAPKCKLIKTNFIRCSSGKTKNGHK